MSGVEVEKGAKRGGTRNVENGEVALSTVKAFSGFGNPCKHWVKMTAIFGSGTLIPPPKCQQLTDALRA